MNALAAYPLASASAAVFWIAMLTMLFPAPRARIVAALTLGPTSGRMHLAGFDALRGLAAAYVAIAHCWWFTYPVFAETQLAAPMLAYGAKAVPIFAALSGFLIHRAAIGIRDVADLRAYAVRRIARIMPVFLLGLVLAVATGRFVALNHGVNLPTLFVADAFLLHAIGFPAFSNPVAWSLYVEVIFYLFAPFYVAVAGRWRPVLTATAATLLLAGIASQVTARQFDLWPFFLGGILASELAGAGARWPRGTAAATALVGFAVVTTDLQGPAFDPFSRLGLVPLDDTGATLGLLFGMVCLMAGLPRAPRLGAVLEIAPLRMLGAISYSVFVLHPFFIALNFPSLSFDLIGQQYESWRSVPQQPGWLLPLVFFPGILPFAALSFVLIERPGMLRGRRCTNATAMGRQASVQE